MARPLTEAQATILLNGTPVRAGVITTAGASTTNATTASAFAIPAGSVIEVIADAACVVTIGASASTSYTNAAFGRPCAIGVPQRFILRNSDTTIAVAAGVAVNVAVFVMN
jgi:hypothetical protein